MGRPNSHSGGAGELCRRKRRTSRRPTLASTTTKKKSWDWLVSAAQKEYSSSFSSFGRKGRSRESRLDWNGRMSEGDR